MEMNGKGSIPKGKSSQNQDSWVPRTPLKPIAPKEPQEDWPGEAHSSRLGGGFPYEFSQEFEEYLESNGGFHNCSVPSAGRAQVFHGSADPSLNSSIGNLSFTDHLALAEANLTVSTDGISSHLMTCLGSQHESDRLQSNPTSQEKCEIINHYQVSVPCWNSYDLNSLPSIVANPASSGTFSNIAPVTPDKSKNVGNKEDSAIPNICQSGQAVEERNMDIGVATRRVDPNEHNCDKELLQPIQSDTHNPDEGSNIDLNKTPQQQKQRRRKHRPKVVKEGKTKRTPKPKTPDPTGSKETSKVKRKYVRRNPHNKSSLPPSAKETEGIADPKAVEVARKSCRRALSFEEEHAPKLGTELNDEKITMRDGQGMGAMAETNEVGRTHEPLRFDRQNETSISQDVLKTYNQTPPRSLNDSNCSTSASPAEEVQAGGLKRGHSRSVYHMQLTPQNMMGAQYGSFPAYQPILNTHGHFPEIYKKKRTEKVTYSKSEFDGSSITSCRVSSVTRQETFCHQNDSEATLHTLKDHCWIPNPQLNNSRAPPILSKNDLDKMPIFHRTTAPSLPEKLTKKRTRGHTRVSDLSSLNGIVCFEEPSFPTNQPPKTYGSPYTCIETLVAESRAILARKKRTRKRVSVVNPAPSGSLEALQKKMFYIDRLVEQFKHLNINNQSAYQDQHALVPYHMENQEKSALVLYRRDGTIVPFDGLFNPVRKRRPRPKVDLDEETTRVWQLLMGNINSEGVDGTNKEKEKWWEEERGVFQGRADSFIARMRLVQGDRRFSLWKGSVVDSVIGVFLTQNVSDHLSSSAFMSLVARFPHKSKNSNRAYSEGTNILVKDPHICTLDPEDTDQNEKIPNQPVTDPNNTASSEDREAVNSSEFFGSSFGGVIPLNDSSCKCATETSPEPVVIKKTKTSVIEGEVRSLDDEILSQTSVVSSQNSTDSPISLAGERIGSCSETNSEAEEFKTRFGSSNSFLELLGMAGATSLPEVHSQGNRNITSNNNSQDADYHSECSQYDQERKIRGRLDDPNISMGSSIIPHSKLTPNSESPEVECLELLEENRSCTFSKKQHENSVHEQSGLTAECTSPAAVQKKLMVSAQISFKNIHSCENHNTEKSDTTQADSRQAGDKEKVSESLPSDQYKKMQQNHLLQNALAENSDETVSTSMVDNKKKIGKLTADSNIKENKKKSDKSLDLMKSNTTHGKGVRDRKTQEKVYKWDNLRKEAQPNGKKREQTTNTMDSLDWEAVRSADVNEIAQTIKERGMNNVLAERIQDFLNRLVAEHGSIDLEWLRDVTPDKAKEYLLSIRGLGLKSVECVRLLTLHHLAFPVDTNVGRIAVRLGWVPLQPLPESLQLHLLELYPVLESIQKYLWPRLCKLDQRTLYELHYQMITFGKVFCTKSKPNCNACPMRGECRHFASAFASARLSLPGPEEKSLVSATESRAKDQNPADIIKPLPLPMPLPQSNQQAESKYESSICEPIIEEPASPEPTCTLTEIDIEDTFFEDPNEIPTIKLNIEEFAQNLQDYMQKNMELQESEMSKALVALTPDVASIPMPKLKNVNQLRTEHQVYELPDTHPLLEGLDRREPDDPCSYLLAIWTPGETANSIQPPERKCNSQEYGNLCNQETCFSCNCIREANSQTVRGTLLIPCRTAMRGSFPLNGTYFQVNEVFADHDSSLNPIDVPRSLIWNLPRRTVYFGTSIPTIFKGLSTEGIQHCFWRGYVCVRGFDRKTRAPRPLMARLHFPASKLVKRKGQTNDE